MLSNCTFGSEFILLSPRSCDNVLEWDNGVRFAPQRYTDFLRNMDVHPYVEATETNTDANCFVVETTRLTDRACSAEYNPFLCQFTCIGEVDLQDRFNFVLKLVLRLREFSLEVDSPNLSLH